MNFTPSHLDAAIDAQREIRVADFPAVFGVEIGSHLWTKFMDHEYSILDFAAYLDSDNFKRLAAYIDGKMTTAEEEENMNRKQEKLHAQKPSPERLQQLVAKHGRDLMAWPRPYRTWLLMDDGAVDYCIKHVPGTFDVVGEAVEHWYQETFALISDDWPQQDEIPF